MRKILHNVLLLHKFQSYQKQRMNVNNRWIASLRTGEKLGKAVIPILNKEWKEGNTCLKKGKM